MKDRKPPIGEKTNDALRVAMHIICEEIISGTATGLHKLRPDVFKILENKRETIRKWMNEFDARFNKDGFEKEFIKEGLSMKKCCKNCKH